MGSGEKSIQNSKFKIEEKTGGEVALASRRVRDKGTRGITMPHAQ
ncbi:MAG: hypothetical protein V7L05_08505 [Nostoc sp.]